MVDLVVQKVLKASKLYYLVIMLFMNMQYAPSSGASLLFLNFHTHGLCFFFFAENTDSIAYLNMIHEWLSLQPQEVSQLHFPAGQGSTLGQLWSPEVT